MKTVAAVVFTPIIVPLAVIAVVSDWRESRKKGWWNSFKEAYGVFL